jgi:hypothetical protein
LLAALFFPKGIKVQALEFKPRNVPRTFFRFMYYITVHFFSLFFFFLTRQVSVSCGIPDFRSRDGIYSRLAIDFPDLPDPQAMFDIQYFSQDPRPFFKFAREIYPGQFKPSPCHRYEKHGELDALFLISEMKL